MTYTSETLDQCADRIVRQEVMCCLSSIVSTLARNGGAVPFHKDDAARDLAELVEQAFELASPIPDYEEAAREDDWTVDGDLFTNKEVSASACASPDDACGWEDLCREFDIEPYDREVFEHWAVTQWLADKLHAEGEKIDDDFGGLCVWARTTTGQGIASDSVIRKIAAAMTSPRPQSWADAIVRGVPSQAAYRAAITRTR